MSLAVESHERSHFDEELRARAAAYVQARGLSIADFADEIGYSRTTLSKYLSRGYVNTVQVEAALKSFFTRVDRIATGTKFAPTVISKKIMECCELALQNRLFIVLYGPPQIGKSTGAREFLRRKLEAGTCTDRWGARSIVFLTANSTTTAASLVRRVCEQLAMPLTGCTPELLERIVVKVRRQPHLFIIDDASFLGVKALEALRYVYDQAGCGLALIGVKTLMERMFLGRGRIAEDLAQLYSRVDLQAYLPAASSQEELLSIGLSHGFDKETIQSLLPHVKRPRELLKAADRLAHLRRVNPAAPLREVVTKAVAGIFQAA